MYNEALHVKKGVEKLALEKLHVLKKSGVVGTRVSRAGKTYFMLYLIYGVEKLADIKG